MSWRKMSVIITSEITIDKDYLIAVIDSYHGYVANLCI